MIWLICAPSVFCINFDWIFLVKQYLLYKKQKALVLIWVDRSRWKTGVSTHYLNTLLIYTVNILCLISAFKKEQTNRVILKKIIYNYYKSFNLESFLLEAELRNHLEKEKLSSDKNQEFLMHLFLAVLNKHTVLNKNPFEVTMNSLIRTF